MATTEVQPAGIQWQGNGKVMFMPGSLAVAGAVSLASDIGKTGALNISFALTSAFAPGGSQNKGNDPRYGSKQLFEAFGYKNFTIPDIVWVDDPQSAGSNTTPKGVMLEDATGYIFWRLGLDAQTDWALAQKVNMVIPVQLGLRWPVSSTGSGDEFAKIAYQQGVAVTGTVLKDIAVTT